MYVFTVVCYAMLLLVNKNMASAKNIFFSRKAELSEFHRSSLTFTAFSNQFKPNSISVPPENLCDVFRGYSNGTLAATGLK